MDNFLLNSLLLDTAIIIFGVNKVAEFSQWCFLTS